MVKKMLIKSIVQINEDNVKSWLKDKGKDPKLITDQDWFDYIEDRHKNSFGFITEKEFID